ncbi:hypothetical protein KLP40_15085 [Hymenobacter sp. NST-14]|uniref:hypothetical protein n=1 Tax=Hymenobacter piscis TaxID=2839984 RepID=UPI001C00B42E|nr:hypothetical protein [Hymenobacter piscis]MBT9394495.1 hypothetical protein [Hymenobacter piscis]
MNRYDGILLGSYLLFVLGGFILNFSNYMPGHSDTAFSRVGVAYYYAVAYLVAQVTVSSDIVGRLRNIPVTVGWLLITIVLGLLNPVAAVFPLLALVLYHIVRLLFWRKYSREFVPCTMAKYGVVRSSSSAHINAEDVRYMAWLFYGGMLSFVLYTTMLILGQ